MKIVIIGASGTVGRAVTEELSRRHEVIRVGRTQGDHQVDITSQASGQALFEKIGPVDAIVSASGGVHFGPLATMTDSEFNRGLKDKLLGQIRLALTGQHYLNEGGYQGVPYADAADYTSGTRVAPSPVNLAYAWNKELAFENGEIILGESTLVLDLPIMIGPGMNIHRHAYNARGVEYYSEDPILSGYVGSAVVQGAQSKGTLVNIKHMGFNDQEINRSGVAVFMNEQKARELELRNLQQAFEGSGKPTSFEGDATKDNTYTSGARGVMTSYNRHGAVAASANVATMVNILQGEWGFHGYNVTDFTGVSLKAAPKESLMAGTTNFCGFGASVDYWNAEALSGDRAMLLAIKNDIHNALYALANSAMLNGVKSTTVVSTVEVMTSWRMAYTACEYAFGALAALSLVFWVVSKATSKGGKKA